MDGVKKLLREACAELGHLREDMFLRGHPLANQPVSSVFCNSGAHMSVILGTRIAEYRRK
jgi:hypothetical protein